MRIALTGATGFLGRYVLRRLAGAGHQVRCWTRAGSDRTGVEALGEWIPGELGSDAAARDLVAGCDAVVHSALYRPGEAFRGQEGDIVAFCEQNVLGTLRLIKAAMAANVERFVFVSTCAVHEVVLDDRPLDEAHPLWATSHYGAHKAAIEKFVHSYGLGHGYDICALRPTGIYGLAHPASDSRWFELIQAVTRGERVTVARGGKEVHADDVAAAIELLLHAPAERIRGQAFNCYDHYISEYDIAHLAREISGSGAEIVGDQTRPKHEIVTEKLRGLGMRFGGETRMRETIAQLVEAARG